MKLGILGTGHVATTLGGAWSKTHDITLGSREPAAKDPGFPVRSLAPPEFMSVLVTEHFALQSAASSTISKSGSRVAIYLSALSSGLVAIGFASSSPHALRYGRWSFLFTMASMVIVVNSVRGGATVALVGTLGVKGPVAISTVVGIVTGPALLTAALRYEHRRLTPQVLISHGLADATQD